VKVFHGLNSQAGQGGNNMTTRTLLALLVTLGACSEDHTIGSVPPDAGVDSSATSDTSAAMQADATSAGVSEAGIATGPAQSWTGWVENYQFPSGSDAIKLSFTSDSAGQIVGHVILGSGTPPPPATDPNVGYPLGFNGQGFLSSTIEGFWFSMVAGSYTGNRLSFGMDETELWAGWCALQTPPVDGSARCLPSWGGFMDSDGTHCGQTGPNGETIIVDCGKLALCSDISLLGGGVCSCTPTGCSYRQDDGETMHFDLAVSGGIASGGSPFGNVHLTKDP
jgi:hypothetical protein